MPLLKQAREKESVVFVVRNLDGAAKDVVCGLYISDGSLNMRVIACAFSNDYSTVSLVDATEVTDNILVKDCPCYSNYVDTDDLQNAGLTAIERLCEGSDMTSGEATCELKDDRYWNWGERRLQFVIVL